MSRSSRRERAVLLIDSLVDDPSDIYEQDVGELLEGADVVSVREEVFERLLKVWSGIEISILTALLDKIGIGGMKGELARVVTDRGRTGALRSAVAALLLTHEPQLAKRVLAKLSAEERAMFAQAPIRALLSVVIEDPGSIGSVSSFLKGADGTDPLDTFALLEEVRRGMGLYPLQVYEDALFHDSLESLIEPVVDLIIEERDPRGVEVLRFIAQNEEGERQPFWKALAERAEREIGGKPAAAVLEAEAWLGYPLPPFPPPVVLLVENPDGTRTFGLLELGRGPVADRKGSVIYDPAPELIEQIPRPPDSVRVPSGIARELFESYWEALGDDESEEISIAFAELTQHLPLAELPRIPERRDPHEDEVRELLEEHPYAKWLLDFREMIAEMEVPDLLEDPTEEWLARGTGLVDDSRQAGLIADAFRMMSLLHQIKGQEDRASVAATLARRIAEEGLSFLGIGPILLERTVNEVRVHAATVARKPSDPWAVEPHEEAEMLRLFLPVAKKQLKDWRVPFVRETYDRLRSEGMSSQDAVRAIALAIAADAKRMTILDADYDDDIYIARLDALTGEASA